MVTITRRELQDILAQHLLWLRSEGGKYADLRGADLRGAFLQGANLWDANLQGAKLNCVNLRGAKLNWYSHDLLSAVLLAVSGDNPKRRLLASWPLVNRDKCWKKAIKEVRSLFDAETIAWAKATLKAARQAERKI